MFICGVNLSSDDDNSILAFTDSPGAAASGNAAANNWADSWRGVNQAGTIWSMFSDDYEHVRGGRWVSPQAYPGYRGAQNAGTYEVQVSTGTFR